MPSVRRLSTGKIPTSVLRRTVLRLTGARSKLVATPPGAGLDFAAVKLEGGYLIVSADPITGVSEGIGEYAIDVSANDVATSGSRPQFAESVLLLPEGATADSVASIASQMDRAARRLGISILGGHTEVTPGLERPIVAVTAMALVKDYVSSSDANAGDTIMMTKTAGLEGTAALADSAFGAPGVSGAMASRARKLRRRLSVVGEAVAAYKTGFVHAMHDCTEGGVLGAAFEMSYASGLGFTMEERAVPVADVTTQLCRRLSLDPLKLIGSGSLLLSVVRGRETDVESALSHVCEATVVGEFAHGRRILVLRDGEEEVLREAPEDELWRVLGSHGR
jgi:hydrogenase expression/formation protein HypE